MKAYSLLVLLLAVSYVNGATFDIKSVSTCTQQSQQGYCTRWEQNGSVQETTGCFPAHTQVYVLKDGQVITKKINQLQIGEYILSSSHGIEQFTEMIGWLHHNSTLDFEFMEINTQSGSFWASGMHNIALQNGSYVFAKELEGKVLYNGQKVEKVSPRTSKGVYSPLTSTGNFFVKMGKNHKTLAHCYAYIRDPQFYEPFVQAIFNGWQYLYGKQIQKEVHPAAQWMRTQFSFLLAEE